MSEAAKAPEDLVRQAHEAFRRGDAARAFGLLAEAEAVFPRDLSIKLQKAMIRRAMGDLSGALAALDEALDIDPYDYVSLLSKAGLVEQISGERAAAAIYKNALKIAPADDKIPAAFRRPTERARDLVARTTERLDEYLREKTAEASSDVSEAARRRFDEAIGVLTGKRKVYVQEPLLLHYPQLPAIPFYDRSHFPWLEELEAATDVIREEMLVAMEKAGDAFAPYIAYPKGAPVNQWEELNHSRRWSSFFLWKDGVRQDGACELCPRTADLLNRLPMARQNGFAPTAMFSALEAHTHIPPHTGSTNARLLCHLPLVLPGPARFRVGNETRDWKMGQAWVFDDTIEHEAWNDADELRVILIIDVWNPYLEPAERELITTLLQARNEFFATN
ncbi:aspartyl/asparaginyl beta-hydroxylase domain-containing protein [Phenylobacterium sp. J367]|uniref:aspartyl/asparaginyl beta-hydroxylase domain-containing protein n=1 Tax=Phenylobacterium sp. J367 TaxID=2898435 RepID=UPI002150892A|nr:aspartyl/asparaginyl beta-hydroxylase domain-containing protein [Phenylobacterium sp. J367]MCR5878328.1 aspartyl/asparaginyl beta-hydroxylase domain-containing protein [Phenylobacterium sp. J367]